MDIYALPAEEQRSTGFSHKAVINFADGDFSAAATSQAYTLFTLADGMIVDRVARYLTTQLSGGGSTAATLSVGDTDSATGFLTATSVLSGATPITTATGDGSYLNQAGGRAYTAAKSLTATLTTTTANVSTLTAGVITVFFRVVDLTKY